MSDTTPPSRPQDEQEPVITLADFLCNCPPGSVRNITDYKDSNDSNPRSAELLLPVLSLDCNSEICNGVRLFDGESNKRFFLEEGADYIFNYTCRHCQKIYKKYVCIIFVDDLEDIAVIIKIGEWPSFGQRLPAKLITLLRQDKDLLFKGKRCEDQGMGIGAFSYYRRVVEHQKNRIIDEIIRVAQKTQNNDIIPLLKDAKKQTSFSSSVKAIKDAIPSSVRIDNHNPLTLLHKALSKGMHVETDSVCLDSAQSIRVILTKMLENIDHALKDEQEVKQAIGRLLADDLTSQKEKD